MSDLSRASSYYRANPNRVSGTYTSGYVQETPKSYTIDRSGDIIVVSNPAGQVYPDPMGGTMPDFYQQNRVIRDLMGDTPYIPRRQPLDLTGYSDTAYVQSPDEYGRVPLESAPIPRDLSYDEDAAYRRHMMDVANSQYLRGGYERIDDIGPHTRGQAALANIGSGMADTAMMPGMGDRLQALSARKGMGYSGVRSGVDSAGQAAIYAMAPTPVGAAYSYARGGPEGLAAYAVPVGATKALGAIGDTAVGGLSAAIRDPTAVQMAESAKRLANAEARIASLQRTIDDAEAAAQARLRNRYKDSVDPNSSVSEADQIAGFEANRARISNNLKSKIAAEPDARKKVKLRNLLNQQEKMNADSVAKYEPGKNPKTQMGGAKATARANQEVIARKFTPMSKENPPTRNKYSPVYQDLLVP